MWSIIWLVIGIVLLLCSQDIISFALIRKLIFPFILVMIGLSLILKDTLNKKVGGSKTYWLFIGRYKTVLQIQEILNKDILF